MHNIHKHFIINTLVGLDNSYCEFLEYLYLFMYVWFTSSFSKTKAMQYSPIKSIIVAVNFASEIIISWTYLILRPQFILITIKQFRLCNWKMALFSDDTAKVYLREEFTFLTRQIQPILSTHRVSMVYHQWTTNSEAHWVPGES
jgi:hypothetical protein